MNKTILGFLFFFLIVFLSQKSFSQISGLAFRDFNANGTRQNTAAFAEPLVNGVIVRAYNASEVLVAADTTGSNGSFGTYLLSVTSGTQVRLEFIIGATNFCGIDGALDFSSSAGATYGSAVRFVTAGAGAININFAINNPYDYKQTGAPTITDTMFVVRQVSGNPAGGGTSGTRNALYKFGYLSEGNTENAAYQLNPPGAIPLATNAQIGTCYGLGYSAYANRAFTSAYMKRHYGFGPANGTFNNAPGAIYIINPTLTTASPAATYFTSLDALGFPTHNSTGTPAYGSGTSYNTAVTGANGYRARTTYPTNGLGVIGINSARNLPAAYDGTSSDAGALGQVGKVSLGDLDISEDGRYIYTTNLFDRKLYKIQLNSNTNPTAVSATTGFSLPNPPLRSASGITNAAATYTGASDNTGFYDGTRGVQRPFAIGMNRGKVYVGAVTTGESSSGQTTTDNNAGNPEYTDLWAYVWEFNPTTNTFNTTPVLQFPLNFNRGTNSDNTNETWKVWRDTVPAPVSGSEATTLQFVQYQQAMLTDIVFDTANIMVLGFRDRWGDQTGYDLPSVNNLGRIAGQAMGDMLRAYYNPATCSYQLESNAKEGAASTKAATAGAAGGPIVGATATGNGPGGGEFYYRDHVYDANDGTPTYVFHLNVTQGALAQIKGVDSVVTTTMDPIRAWSGGVSWFSNTSGDNGRDYEIFSGAGTGDFPAPPVGEAGKANGLGDLEFLGSLPPLEIGNRVWNDANGDGIQNANETGIANVTILLYTNGADGIPGNGDDVQLGAGTTTDANGNWYFNTSNIVDGDPTVAGNQAGPQPNYNYNVRIGSADWSGGLGVGDLSSYQLTKTDKLSNGELDYSDNDAALNATSMPMISILTGDYGQNNHNLDFGFKQLSSIGDKVWKDADKDGIQDTGEPGVAGVTVALYQNGSDGAPGTNDDVFIGTTVTDAYGIYLFDNLAASTNAATSYNVGFTLPANYQFTTQTNTQVTGTSDVTNTTTLSSGSTAANGSDANATTGRTGSFWLTAGEAERGVDAGIIFNQPSVNSIGDRVWLDTDSDGVQDATEAGVSGVTVTLYASDGVTVIATTITDASGNYLFNNLPDGNYRVGFTQPTGLIFTSKGGDNTSGGGGDSVTDSDVNDTGVNFGKTDLINLDASSSISTGVNYTNVDAGLVTQPAATCSLGDKVWNDLDNDGVQDAGEPGVAGVTVTLYAGDGTTVSTTTVTDAFGNYIFNNLSAGNYVIGFGTAAGFIRSSNQFTGTSYYDDNNANPSTGKTPLLTLAAGTRDLTIDAALVSTSPNTARVGDRVWFDVDKNGTQDAGEIGLGGITVTLYNNAGTAIATTVTDANGNYQFTNLAAGTYSVGFSNFPDGYSLTTTTGTTAATASTNSDANTATGRTAQFALAAGESLQGLDAGLVTGVASGLGSLGNRIWYDLNGDGIQNVGTNELGVPGMTVTLLDAGIDGILGNGDDGVSRTTTTNALGEYMFTGLAAGNYAVQFGVSTNQLPAGYTTNPNQGADDAVDSDGASIASGISTTGVYSLAQGEDNLTVDLGITPPATTNSLGNYVWFDQDNDGIQDSGEPGVAGVMVTLYNSAGTPISYTTTNTNGEYLFAGLADGTYSVGFSNLPAGFDLTTKETTNTISGGSDADIATGRTATVTLNSGNRNDRTLDGGIVSTRAALGNFVWSDTDGDGVQDAGEPGVPGVTVTLYRPGFGLDDIAGNGDDNLPVASMITDQNGAYLFSNLVAGTYQVEFSTIPSGLSFTQQNTPGDNQNNTNSDAVPVVGNPIVARTGNIVLTAGEVDLTIDAGLFKPRAIIGNYVWADVDSDGIQDAGEPGAAGVTVYLINSSENVIAVAVTDANGFYQFPNVAPGTYSLGFFNLPNGTSFSPANQTVDSDDSDVIGNTILGITVLPTTSNLTFDAGIINFRTLPISKLLATATLAGEVATINWLTENEVNTSHFILERSVDGINFAEVGQLTAGGNVSGEARYTLPNNVSGLSSKVYYRIKLIEADGKIRYSNIAAVNIIAGSNVKIWPNPFVDQVNISLKVERNTQITVSIVDVIGRTNVQRSYTLVKGTNQLSINNLGSFPAGTYAVKVTAENGELLQTIKLVK
jgi:hypothetical protein